MPRTRPWTHNQKNCGGEVPGGLAWVMTISLYDLSVPTFLQTMRAVSGFLDRAAKHCAETGADPDDFVRARLYPDMAPFPDRSPDASCRVGTGGREDRRVRPTPSA